MCTYVVVVKTQQWGPGRRKDVVCEAVRGRSSVVIARSSAGGGVSVRVRCFLHYRHERDDNTLDWQAQDGGCRSCSGVTGVHEGRADAAYWMRLYFRHARSVERQLKQTLEEVSDARGKKVGAKAAAFWVEAGLKSRKGVVAAAEGFRVERGRVVLDGATAMGDARA